MDKIIWAVSYNSPSDLLETATRVGATGVAIRTSNNIEKALPLFERVGIDVFGWRWPSADYDPAMREADKVVALLAKGMAGYYVDPEGERGKPYDWDRSGLEKLAEEFCGTIKAAAADKPLGVTSHYRAKAVFPRLPWAAFFAHADVLLPQSYWRVAGGVVGHGIPADNYARGIEFWTKAGGEKGRIVPMAGELGFATPAEIRAYAAAAQAAGRTALHFYTWLGTVKPAVWDAIAAV